jgi:hypothetical protein
VVILLLPGGWQTGVSAALRKVIPSLGASACILVHVHISLFFLVVIIFVFIFIILAVPVSFLLLLLPEHRLLPLCRLELMLLEKDIFDTFQFPYLVDA